MPPAATIVDGVIMSESPHHASQISKNLIHVDNLEANIAPAAGGASLFIRRRSIGQCGFSI